MDSPKAAKTSIRIEVIKNDGQKAPGKPLIVQPNANLADLKKQACNSVKLKYDFYCPSSLNSSRYTAAARLFTLTGEEIYTIESIQPNKQYCISKGEDFIKVAVKAKVLCSTFYLLIQ
jgi:hypothetical protein